MGEAVNFACDITFQAIFLVKYKKIWDILSQLSSWTELSFLVLEYRR